MRSSKEPGSRSVPSGCVVRPAAPANQYPMHAFVSFLRKKEEEEKKKQQREEGPQRTSNPLRSGPDQEKINKAHETRLRSRLALRGEKGRARWKAWESSTGNNVE